MADVWKFTRTSSKTRFYRLFFSVEEQTTDERRAFMVSKSGPKAKYFAICKCHKTGRTVNPQVVCKDEVTARGSVGVIGVIKRTNHIIASTDARQKGRNCCVLSPFLSFFLWFPFSCDSSLHIVINFFAIQPRFYSQHVEDVQDYW